MLDDDFRLVGFPARELFLLAMTLDGDGISSKFAAAADTTSHLVSRFLLHRAGFARSRGALGSGRLAVGGSAEAFRLVGDADQEHGLARVLQEIDDPVVRFFQIDALAVGQQMNVGSGGQRLTQALARITFAEALMVTVGTVRKSIDTSWPTWL